MTVQLRPYQQDLKARVQAEWDTGRRNVVMRADTGAGKTATLADIVNDHNGASCIIAHRKEIVNQLSLALAKLGLVHDVIASQKNRQDIAKLHARVVGRVLLQPGAKCRVASVDTLIRRDLAAWAATVTLWVTDEGHHLVLDNKWHKAVDLFTHPEVRGLLPTATPKRADGKGLGCKELGGDGVAHAMVEGPPMRWLITEGYLCDYKIILAQDHLTQYLGDVGSTGDWSTAQQRKAVEASGRAIIGDVVATYAEHRNGPHGPRNAVLFATDVKTAGEMLDAYRAAGFRAELITGETDDLVRARAFESLAEHKLDIALTVDIVSEGTDIPALDIGIFARSTASLAVYMQQFGRVLRPVYADGYDLSTRQGRLAAIAAGPKPYALIIDHVGNLRHGPPDKPRVWSLASRDKKGGGGAETQYRVCLAKDEATGVPCGQPYEKFRTHCPFCGAAAPVPEPGARSSPEMVAGDMVMLDAEALEALRQAGDENTESLEAYKARLAAQGLPGRFVGRNAKHHAAKLDAHAALAAVMEQWGGYRRAEGLSDREMQRLFWERYGVDVHSVRLLDRDGAAKLLERLALDAAVKMV